MFKLRRNDMSTGESWRSREKLANLLRQQMEVCELTVEAVAEKANVVPVVVQRLLDCVPNPTRPEISRIIGAVGFSKPNRISAEKYRDTFSPSKKQRKDF